ncbi:MAG: hypothetical protein AMXMBFR77_17610 [Phycisphaerales bacterium]|nr:MAG: hypothetical protein BroJett004_17770 [Planctomycetota bacterium]
MLERGGIDDARRDKDIVDDGRGRRVPGHGVPSLAGPRQCTGWRTCAGRTAGKGGVDSGRAGQASGFEGRIGPRTVAGADYYARPAGDATEEDNDDARAG